MPQTTYPYSILNDFPSGLVELSKFDVEIRNSAITTSLVRIDTNGDLIEVVFSDALSAGEKTILDGDITGPAGGLIAAHDNTLPTFRKTADQSVSNSTTLVSDSELKFIVTTNEKLDFKFVVFFNLAGTASGIKLAVNAPAGTVYFRTAIGIFNANIGSFASSALKITPDDPISIVLASTGNHYAIIEGCLENGPNIGYVGLRFAQNQSDNNAVTIKKGSLVNVSNDVGDRMAPAISGMSGWSGTSGLSGASGASGWSGTSGFSGTFSGFSGNSGASGWTGTSGFSGFGPVGDSGHSGVSGFSGAGTNIDLTVILSRFWLRL